MQAEWHSKEQPKVGITEFISQGRQLPAITKYLFSDFIVNQIDKQHQLVTLNAKPDLDNLPKVTLAHDFTIPQTLLDQIKAILDEPAAESIAKLYHQLECGERVGAWEVIVEKELSKEGRTGLHNFVREELHLIESVTQQGGKIRLKYNKNLRKMDPRARKRYTHFTLYKHGIDTFNALFRLSKAMGICQKLFSTAGLKDKRGHTTQRVSVYNTDMPTLLKFYKEAYRNKEIWIADFTEFNPEKVEVGGLSGNQFGLILRLLNKEDGQEMLRRVESLKTGGMVNYFGLQRFGQFATKTYEFGILYARREWKELVEAILLSDCNSEGVNHLKREIYESKKYGKAEKSLHNKYKIEKLLFRGLSRFGDNYQNAFEALPRGIKTLYTHSLQSYLWNTLASRRLKQLGLVLHEGDIVGHHADDKPREEEKLIQKPEEGKEEDEEGVPAEEEGGDEENLDSIVVTAQNKSQYTINDLVLPLYGPQTRLVEGTWLQKNLTEELKNLNLTEADFLQSAKAQNAKAAWRRVLVVPEVVEAELMSHSIPKQELQAPFYTIGDRLKVTEGELSSLRVVIKLPKSAYATMAIREMLHIPSEFDVQRQLNSKYEEKYSR